MGSGRPGLEDETGFLKAEARVAGKQFFGIAIAEVAEEIGFPFAVGKELGIDLLAVESGHGAAVEPEGAGGEDKIGALQGAIAEGGVMTMCRISGEHGTHIARGEKLEQLFVERGIPSDDRAAAVVWPGGW